MSTQKTFSALLTQLPNILHWIRSELHLFGVGETTVRKIELASEEAIVNVIHHGYKGKEGLIDITLRKKGKKEVEITIKDQGPPFNPLERVNTFNPLAAIEERSVGGLGILFIRQYMDEVQYKREKDSNILILLKNY